MTRRPFCGSILVLSLCLGALSVAQAHNFWIEPQSYRPSIGQVVGIGLKVGDYAQSWPLPRNAGRIETFESIGPDGERPIVGRDGSDPAGTARFSRPGSYVLVYRSNHAFTEMEPAKFDEYLQEKGLQEIIALRRERGAAGGNIREAYSRYAKSLLQAGATAAGGGDRVIGLKFEIVAGVDLAGRGGGAGQSFQLLFDGKPVRGTLLTAMRRDEPQNTLRGRTDEHGQVTLPTVVPGIWLVTAVKMLPAVAGLAADWESFWASLTFEIPAPPLEASR
jgi:uncharacterized GH25 family protein